MTIELSTEYLRLQRLANAYTTVAQAEMSHEEVLSDLDKHFAARSWLMAERQWQSRVREWLAAERKWHVSQQRLSDATYEAGRRGWDSVKKFVPNLDGVRVFADLPESLQFRYAAFAAGVLGGQVPEEIKSLKQETREAHDDVWSNA